MTMNRRLPRALAFLPVKGVPSESPRSPVLAGRRWLQWMGGPRRKVVSLKP
jgi:hypothetical protein